MAQGFGSPPFDDGSRVVVRGSELALDPGQTISITTLRAAAAFVHLALSPDPGVGHDLPPYEPDVTLPIDRDASLALGAWYELGQQVLEELRGVADALAITEAQLWPEHFDYAVTVTGGSVKANVGFSPGDSFEAEPYVYVGPHLTDGLDGAYWNAPFGAFLPYAQLTTVDDPAAAALAFIVDGLRLLARIASAGE